MNPVKWLVPFVLVGCTQSVVAEQSEPTTDVCIDVDTAAYNCCEDHRTCEARCEGDVDCLKFCTEQNTACCASAGFPTLSGGGCSVAR